MLFEILFNCFVLSYSLSKARANLLQPDMQFVYSQTYVQKFDITNPDGAYTKIKTAKKANLVFASAGQEGILVIDSHTNYGLARINFNDYINTLEVTSDGNFVFLSLNNTVSIASFESRSSLQILSQSNFPTNITDMVLDYQESVLYAVGVGGYVVAYDVTNKFKINQLCVFNTYSVTVHTIKISLDNNWLILANDQVGLQILKIIIKNSTSTNQSYSLNFTIAAQAAAWWKIVDAVITDQMDYIYSIDNWYGIFISKFNSIPSVDQSQYPIQINNVNFWPFQTLNPSTYCLNLIQKSTYLTVGLRSQGLFIFSIQDRENPTIYQIIPVISNSFSIAVSSKEDYIYYSNAESIFIFQQVSLNLNNNYPNLFNLQQSIFGQTSQAYYKWRCSIRQIGQYSYFFGAIDFYGYNILNVTDPYRYQQIYTYQYQSSIVDSITLSSDSKYLLVPIQENNTSIVVYDVSIITNPVEVYRLKMEQTNHDEAIFISKNQNFVALSFDDGALLIDSSKLPQLYLLDYWKKYGYMIGECSSVIVTNDNKYVVGSVRSYGYFSLSIHLNDTSNILQYQYTLKTLGGEGLIPSMYDDRYLFFYDGSRGIGVMDATQLPILVVISRLALNGWSNLIVPIYQDNYFLVAQNEQGMVSLVDATDKANLLLISQFTQNGQSAQSICLTQDEQQMFVNNNFGTLVMPLQSQIKLHSEFQLISVNSSGYTNYTRYQNNQFQVGQQIKMTFIMLYPIEGAQIIGAQYYLNYLIQDLPSWIQFDPVNQSILMTIDKQALGMQYNGTSLNMILLKTAIPINQEYFIFNLDDGSSTSESDSIEIYNTLRTQEIITNNGFLSSNYDYTLDLHINVNGTTLSSSIQSMIREKLQRSVFINQILFYVSPSLQLNFTDPVSPLLTLSQSMEISLQVEEQEGKFLLSNFQGVVLSSSNQQNQLILKGSLQSINHALQQKVVFFPLNDLSKIYVTVVISDDINYSQQLIYKASECSIIRQKIKLSSNSNISLKQQFNQKYVDGIISIQSLFSIDFAADSFLDEGSSQIQYQAYIVNGNLLKEIQSDSWIQFRVNSGFFSFQGTPSSSQLYQIVQIRVVADDGYSQAYDEFVINIKDIPFTYVLNIILQVLGPMLALLKVYYSRYLFLNCIYKSKVTFSQENATVGQLYIKKFILMGDDMEKCINLFQGFIQEENKKIKEKPQIKCNLSKKNSFSHSKILSPQINTSSEFQKKSVIELDITTANSDKKEQKSSNYSNLLKKYTKAVSDQINKINFTQQLNETSLMDDKFMQNKQSEFQMENVLNQINQSQISFKLGGKKYTSESFQLDFKNKDSRIYKGLESLAARYFLKKDLKSYNLYKYLKLFSLENSIYNKNDWYKHYISVHPNQKKDIYGIQVPFPTLSLQEQEINLALQKLNSKMTISISSAINLGFNFDLIKKVLFSDALGLVNYIPNYFNPCIGISIHLHSYEIKAVQSYKQVSDSRFSYIRRLLNIEYNEYGTSKNRSLPNWLELEHNNGVIQLIGIPMSQDAENILLRVINSKDFVVQQFTLNISQQDNNIKNQLQNTFNETYNLDNNRTTIDEQNNCKSEIIKKYSIYCKNQEKSAFHKQQVQYFNSNLIDESPINQYSFPCNLPIDFREESLVYSKNHQLIDQKNQSIKKNSFSLDQMMQENKNIIFNISQHLQSKQKNKILIKQNDTDKNELTLPSNEQNTQNQSPQSNNDCQKNIQLLSSIDIDQQSEGIYISDVPEFQFQYSNNKDKHVVKNIQNNQMLQEHQ